MINLQFFRDQSPGLADLLNFALVASDGVVLGKDGALMGGWFYNGPDADSSSSSELNAVSARLNAALLRLGSGWMIHCDAIRMQTALYPMDGSKFPDPVSRFMDEERRAIFEAAGAQYETVYALILSYLPPKMAESKIYDLMIDDPDFDSMPKDIGEKSIQFFERTLSDIEIQLSSTFRLDRIRSQRVTLEDGSHAIFDRLLQYLSFSITGENHPIRLPRCPMYIDRILGLVDIHGGLSPKIGKRHLSVITIEGLPEESWPVILRNLDNLPIEYRWSTRFLFIDQQEALTTLKAYRKRWKQKIRGFRDQLMQNYSGPVDQDAMAMVSDAEAALAEASSGVVAYGYYTSVILLMHEDKAMLSEQVRGIKSLIHALGFSPREEDVNAIEAWLGSIPGHGVQNVRRPVIHTGNLSDLLPTSSVWSGAIHCPSPLFPKDSPPLMLAATRGRTAFRLNLHVSDVGHTVILGPTGSGKSTLLVTLESQWLRYPKARVINLEKGKSSLPLTLAVGGQHFDIGSDDGALQMCPLAEIDEPSDVLWAEEWIEDALKLQGVKTGPRDRSAISDAMRRLQRSEVRSLTDFFACLQDRELREALEFYTGRMLDGRSDNLKFSNFQTYEIERLMQMGEKHLLPVLTYLFRRIDKASDGRPTLLTVDEAWIALGHPAFRDRIREWLKVKRKSNVSVILATQSISDAEKSGILDVILESCPTRIFLANPAATEEGSRKFYESAGLSSQKMEIIKNMTPKLDYFLTSPLGDRVFQIGPTPFSLAFTGAGSKQDIEDIQRIHKEHGANWISKWLEHRGIQ